jgi:hypothetical protein
MYMARKILEPGLNKIGVVGGGGAVNSMHSEFLD